LSWSRSNIKKKLLFLQKSTNSIDHPTPFPILNFADIFSLGEAKRQREPVPLGAHSIDDRMPNEKGGDVGKPSFFAVLTFCTLTVCAMRAGPTRAAIVTSISPVVEDPVTGNQYQLLSNADWADSEAEAESLNGHLATISTPEEQNFVFDVFGGYGGVQRILWIGLYDPTQDLDGGTHADNFVWVSGAPVTYTNWDAGEPNDSNDQEFWTAIYYPNYDNPGSWNDWSEVTTDPIGIPFFGVVQFIPEPASALTMGCAAALFLLRRRK
jgi:Lectin C-type domain